MIKEHIRSTCLNLLRQIDKSRTYHPIQVDHVLEQAINQVYFEIYRQDPRALGQYTKRYTAKTISTDATSGRYYTTVGVRTIALPDKRKGVRTIMHEADRDVYFAPVTDQELYLMEEGDADGLTVTAPIVVYYVVRPDIIEYKNMSAALAAGTVTLDLVVPFTDLADTDNIPLPMGKDYDIIRMAIEMFGVVPPKDLTDNNA